MIKISEILAYLEKENIPFSFSGNVNAEVECFSSLGNYKPGTMTWVKKQESIPTTCDPRGVLLAVVSEEVACEFPNMIRSSQSKRAFFSVMERFFAQEEARPMIGNFTYISPKVRVGQNVRIGHNCTLDGDIVIGDNTIVWNHVTIINRVRIGEDCEIHSGAVIGHDGFGYTENTDGKKTMVRHFGGVSIGNRVHIGDNVCVCRGTIDDTVLADGVKVDNLSHIGHNCRLDENVALAFPCRLGGSSHLKKNAYLSGAIVRNQCVVGENAFVGMGAVVVKDVEAGATVVGNPAKPFEKRRS